MTKLILALLLTVGLFGQTVRTLTAVNGVVSRAELASKLAASACGDTIAIPAGATINRFWPVGAITVLVSGSSSQITIGQHDILVTDTVNFTTTGLANLEGNYTVTAVTSTTITVNATLTTGTPASAATGKVAIYGSALFSGPSFNCAEGSELTITSANPTLLSAQPIGYLLPTGVGGRILYPHKQLMGGFKLGGFSGNATIGYFPSGTKGIIYKGFYMDQVGPDPVVSGAVSLNIYPFAISPSLNQANLSERITFDKILNLYTGTRFLPYTCPWTTQPDGSCFAGNSRVHSYVVANGVKDLTITNSTNLWHWPTMVGQEYYGLLVSDTNCGSNTLTKPGTLLTNNLVLGTFAETFLIGGTPSGADCGSSILSIIAEHNVGIIPRWNYENSSLFTTKAFAWRNTGRLPSGVVYPNAKNGGEFKYCYGAYCRMRYNSVSNFFHGAYDEGGQDSGHVFTPRSVQTTDSNGNITYATGTMDATKTIVTLSSNPAPSYWTLNTGMALCLYTKNSTDVNAKDECKTISTIAGLVITVTSAYSGGVVGANACTTDGTKCFRFFGNYNKPDNNHVIIKSPISYGNYFRNVGRLHGTGYDGYTVDPTKSLLNGGTFSNNLLTVDGLMSGEPFVNPLAYAPRMATINDNWLNFAILNNTYYEYPTYSNNSFAYQIAVQYLPGLTGSVVPRTTSGSTITNNVFGHYAQQGISGSGGETPTSGENTGQVAPNTTIITGNVFANNPSLFIAWANQTCPTGDCSGNTNPATVVTFPGATKNNFTLAAYPGKGIDPENVAAIRDLTWTVGSTTATATYTVATYWGANQCQLEVSPDSGHFEDSDAPYTTQPTVHPGVGLRWDSDAYNPRVTGSGTASRTWVVGATGSVTGISDGLTYSLPLTPGTVYYYMLTCGGAYEAGSITTAAAGGSVGTSSRTSGVRSPGVRIQ